MKTIQYLSALLLMVATLTWGKVISEKPVETIYWRQFNAVFSVGEKVVAVGPRGIVTFGWNGQTTQLEEISHCRFDMMPQRSKLFGDELWVVDTANRIHRFAVDPSLSVAHRQSIRMPQDFADFSRYGEDIIISRYFDGLWRYSLGDGADPQFIDTSYRGILMTTLMTEGNTLYALDQYNGIMRYDLEGDSFGTFEEYLYSEYEGTSFDRYSSSFFLTGTTGGIIQGSFGKTGSGVEKVLPSLGRVSQVTVIEDRFVVQSERRIAWIDRDNPYVNDDWPVDDGLRQGAIYYPGSGDAWFLYPRLQGGIARYSLLFGADPLELLDRPGPVTGLAFAEGRLFAGGRHNPIDVFTLDSTGRPTTSFTVTESHPATSAIAITGDTVLAVYPEAERLGVVEVDVNTGISIVVAAAFIDTVDLLDVNVFPAIRTNRSVVAIRYPTKLDIFELTDSSGLVHVGSWQPPKGPIQAYEMLDSMVVFATEQDVLWFCNIDSTLALGQWASKKLSSGFVQALEYSTPYLRVFRQGFIDVYNFTTPFAPELVGTAACVKGVSKYQQFSKYLFTVGHDGMQIFDVDDSIPVLIDTASGSGILLAVDSNHFVISDGHAIDFYQLPLFTPGNPPDDSSPPPPPPLVLPQSFAISQNYPNPFNGSTYIEYDIPAQSEVLIELFNLLGQRVRTLVSAVKDPGRYRILWNGVSDAGSDVASGVYYYRFTAGKSHIVKKMLYLK